MRTVLLCFGAALSCLVVWAADPAIKQQVQVAWQAAELPLQVPMLQTIELQTPGVPGKPGQLTVLRLQVRLDCPANSGWNKFLALEINGRKVGQTLGGTRNGPQRVVNRDLKWFPEGYETDYVLFRDNQLNVVFGPDFQQFDQRLAHEGEESFWYVLDVSDLVLPEAGNAIRLTNLAQPGWFEGQPHPMVLGDVSIGYLPASLRPSAAAAPLRPLPTGKTASGQGFAVTLTREGGMAVQLGKEHYVVETSLTWPHGALNWLGCKDRLAQEQPQEWQVSRAELSSGGGRVVAEGKFYRLTRDLSFDGPRLRVADRIENRTSEDLGLQLAYELSAGGPVPLLHLGGDGTPSLNFLSEVAANPTVFAAQQRSGLGWLAEDDVLRVQLYLRNQNGQVSAYTPNFGLPPRQSHTVRWTLYPSTAADYWAFVNQVRRDWSVNFPIEGPFAFFGHCRDVSQMAPEAVRARLEPRQVRLAAMHPWTAYEYPYERGEHRDWWREAERRIHEVSPATKCLVMMEPPLESRVHKDRVDDDPYRDAVIMNRDGSVGFDLGYGPGHIGQQDWDAGWRLVWRYPTLTNTWLQYLLYDVAFALQECGAGGMYIDCFSYAFNRNWARYTYDRWDGHTVDLDPDTHEITAKYADAALLSSGAQRRIVEAIQAKGGAVVANTEPATEEMRKVRCWRFVETGSGPQYDRDTHLYTPIALGMPSGVSSTRGFVADVVANLEYGALYYYYGVPATGLNYGCVNRMFPFTPRELHAGWLLGEERIITARSGSFGWGDRSRVRAYHYDTEGIEQPLSIAPQVVKGASIYAIKLKPGEIAILERVR